MKRALFLSTCLIFAAGTLPSGPALAAPHSAAHVAPWLAKATLKGPAEDSRPVQLSLFLGLRNTDGLKALISAQSTPHSPQYGKYLTSDQFRAAYAPHADQVARVQQALKALGFTVDYTPKSGLFVNASGTASQVRVAFGVTQNLYSYKGMTLRANAEQPRLPASLAGIVSYVAGLDDTQLLRRASIRRLDDDAKPVSTAAVAGTPNAPPPTQAGIPSPFCSTYWGDHTATLSSAPGLYPSTVPWLLCSYVPDQIRQAYGIDKVTQDGTGVRVGIVDLYASPTIMHDANKYAKKYGQPELTYMNFQEIIPPGIKKVPADDPCGPQGWYGEETLDVEAVHSVAPGASIVYAGEACTDPGNTGLYNLIDSHLVDIVTNSYSYNGEYLPADYIAMENEVFMQAAATGISVLFSSGDNGDLAALNGIASGTWEATSPYVTAVGGTSLALYDSTGRKSEWGWGDYRAYLASATVADDGKSITTSGIVPPFAYYSGEGGGPSLGQLAPDYQVNVPYSLSGFTVLADGTSVPLEAPHRVTPDISMVADPYTGFLVGETYTTSGDPVADSSCTPSNKEGQEYCLQGIGGTSLASPLFAGVLALANQARFAAGKSTVGFVNPALYTMAIGKPGTTNLPISDVNHPTTPTALLRGYVNDFTRVRLIAINSTTNGPGTKVIEGKNTSLRTKKGYDAGAGLGTPNVPALIDAFLAE